MSIADTQNDNNKDSSKIQKAKFGIAWSDNYSIGHELVDSQHKRLFEMVSALVESCMDGRDSEMVKETLGFLADYTVRHFSEEEALQLKYDYPEYDKHKQMHEDFKVTVGDLIQDYIKNSSTTELSNNVNKIVVKWLVQHILNEDKKIGTHIQKTLP